jgi:hypothetical protein
VETHPLFSRTFALQEKKTLSAVLVYQHKINNRRKLERIFIKNFTSAMSVKQGNP